MTTTYQELIDDITCVLVDISYRTESLVGYCEYLDGDDAPSLMLAHLLTEIRDKLEKLLSKIDTDTSHIEHENYRKTSLAQESATSVT